MADPRADMPGPPGLTEALGRNIETVSRRRADDSAKASPGVRLSSRIGRLIGRMSFVYANLAFYGVWTAVHYGVIPGAKGFDPALTLMGSLASAEGIFLSLFILITQNHEAGRTTAATTSISRSACLPSTSCRG